ncbi:uncharacterized protein LOC135845344 [Planococcus citri]|uniref:uncharacterized protein LOC135845344 n=1 Tax=Planococcus citri TaxID=170843 RepID=UPI0031F7B216
MNRMCNNMFDIILRYIPFYSIAVAWFISVFLSGTYSVSITELKVPPYIKNGTGSATILDCLYSLRPEEQTSDSGLVVKWFFNKSPNPVYQWIYNQKPQGLGVLKGRLWLDYRATDNNATAHRALYIYNPTVELSGEYKCTVSTNVDEDFSIKKMVVFAPEKRLEMFHTRFDLETINVTCRAIGVYPMPIITLYNDSIKFNEVVISSAERTNAYDVTAYVLIPDTDLSSPTTFDCDLQIPNTPYSNKKTMQYYPGNTESLSSISDNGVSISRRSILDVSIVTLASYLILNIRF